MSPDRDAIALDEPKHRAGAEPAYAAARGSWAVGDGCLSSDRSRHRRRRLADSCDGSWTRAGRGHDRTRDNHSSRGSPSGDPVSRPRRRIPEPASDLGGDRDRAHTRALSSFAAVIVAISAARRSSELANRLAGVSRGRGAAWLVALLSRELRKPQFSIEAGILDVLVGLTAVPTALLVARGSPYATGIGIVWNAVGLFDFLLAIGLARIPGGGPGHMLITRTPALLALRPAVLGIVALGVPLAIILHVLSLWQLVAH